MKPWYKSQTIWVNTFFLFLAGLVPVLESSEFKNAIPAELYEKWAIPVIAIYNVWRRFKTAPLKLK
jgi:hypothetical protein